MDVTIYALPTDDFNGGPPPLRVSCQGIEFEGSWCIMRNVIYQNGTKANMLAVSANQVSTLKVS